MNGENMLDCFILNYDSIVDKHINSIYDLNHLFFKRDWYCNFIFYF